LVAAPAGADPKKDVVIRFQDPKIIESSGLVARGGDFLTINDSGDEGRVFLVDGETGETIGETFWSQTPTDVEALAPATGDDVWLGDIGDNKQVRDWVEVTKVAVQEGDRAQAGQTFRLAYPKGPRNAEALLVNPVTGRLYVATKLPLGGYLYEAPATLDPIEVNKLEPIAKVGTLVTDGAFFPDGEHLILRGYGRATVYSFPEMTVVGSFDLPEEPQGEGIAVSSDGDVFVCSEGKDQPVLRVTLPRYVLDGLGPAPTTPSASTSPRPGSSPDTSDSEGLGALPLLGGGLVAVGALVGAAVFLRRRSRGRA
jgi:hypothetical protein